MTTTKREPEYTPALLWLTNGRRLRGLCHTLHFAIRTDEATQGFNTGAIVFVSYSPDMFADSIQLRSGRAIIGTLDPDADTIIFQLDNSPPEAFHRREIVRLEFPTGAASQPPEGGDRQ